MRRIANLATVGSLAASLALVSGCRREAEDAHAESSPTTPDPDPDPDPDPAATAADVQDLEASSYTRSLEAQLDLVAGDADAYFVARDLGPVLDQAKRIQQVMAGPLAQAIPALAKLGGGSGEARLAQLGRASDLLALVLAGVEASGIRLDQGLVISQGQGHMVVAFAAEDLARLGALAALAGDDVALGERCGALTDSPGWFACSLDGPEGLASYAPAGQGAALAKRLAERLPGVDLRGTNLAVSVATGPRPLDAALRTDPGLWELSMPVPLPPGSTRLLRPGPAPALRALLPGTSFVWLRADPAILSQNAPVGGEVLSGELWFGAVDDPPGLVAEASINSASAASLALESLAGMVPAEPITPEGFDDLQVELDRASLELDGERVPSIGAQATGAAAERWSKALGVDARARVWAHGDYLSAALGQTQTIPAALAKRAGQGPSPAAVRGLPPTLAAALVGGEVGLAVHMVLDHWQAPPSEAELDALLLGVGVDVPGLEGSTRHALTASFAALAPWSSVSVWLHRSPGADGWLGHLSIVPFAAGAEGPEAEAASAVLDAVLDPSASPDRAHARGQTGYRQLLDQFPSSARAPSYRARIGEAPTHHAAVGMIELGALAAVAIPAFSEYLNKAKSSEAPAQTQSILSAALAAHERAGSCAKLIGETPPTPALSVACHLGDSGRCQPADEGPFEAGRYPLTAWTEDPLWSALGYVPKAQTGTGGHRFHYTFAGEATPGGGCRLIVRAFGDLDGDGEYSTYEREATIADDGSQRLSPLEIHQPNE